MGLILAGLFLLPFVTKRRFGTLGLGLCAGLVLSASASAAIASFLQQQGVQLITPPLASVVSACLILLPVIPLLFTGPTYHHPLEKLVGSCLFTLFALTLLLGPLGGMLNSESLSQSIYGVLISASNLIIISCVLIATADMALARRHHKGLKHKGGH